MNVCYESNTFFVIYSHPFFKFNACYSDDLAPCIFCAVFYFSLYGEKIEIEYGVRV